MTTPRPLLLLDPCSVLVAVALLPAWAWAAGDDTTTAAGGPDPGLPYVYTKWEQITTENGLPNDHIFAVRADPRGGCVWIGTEGGLSRYDKKTKEIRSWTEKEGLPWRVVTGIDVNPKTGEVWLGLFGGGLTRFSAGRFDHFHQLNSGLVNDVVYAVAVDVERDHVWCATTAGASRYDTKKDKWDIYTEQNAPMEEIWNYNVCYRDDKVHLAVWGSGILEFDTLREHWKIYTDPDGEMEIDLYRDDGVPHVITTGASYADEILWVSTYFGCARYDGRHWRGYFDHECGLPSNFNNNLKARSGQECWYCTDKGLGACMDAETCTWVTYVPDGKNHAGKAIIKRENQVLKTVDTGYNVPQAFIICVDFDGPDVWVGTSKGVGHGLGEGYYPRLRPADAAMAQK
ncbi:MAG TPA: two-component regulator propeller domain-containing protein [Verrucomicrobiota bacterium]|mgnify:CR=1 FL=1|nr:two-component regulator propeller domain-containing protein [Verrucomicrobiota bacterium]